MRNTLFLLSLAAGHAIVCTSSAGALPISAATVKEVAATTSPLRPAQYAETWSRRGGRIKCFRVIHFNYIGLPVSSRCGEQLWSQRRGVVETVQCPPRQSCLARNN